MDFDNPTSPEQASRIVLSTRVIPFRDRLEELSGEGFGQTQDKKIASWRALG